MVPGAGVQFLSVAGNGATDFDAAGAAVDFRSDCDALLISRFCWVSNVAGRSVLNCTFPAHAGHATARPSRLREYQSPLRFTLFIYPFPFRQAAGLRERFAHSLQRVRKRQPATITEVLAMRDCRSG
ncbi:hypothetical protein D3C76_218390 [compost metagenome]